LAAAGTLSPSDSLPAAGMLYKTFNFYRAMHYSAKRGNEITCRPSVVTSVTLVDQDHIGWKSCKLIARTLSPTPSLFDRGPKTIHLLPGEHGEILAD